MRIGDRNTPIRFGAPGAPAIAKGVAPATTSDRLAVSSAPGAATPGSGTDLIQTGEQGIGGATSVSPILGAPRAPEPVPDTLGIGLDVGVPSATLSSSGALTVNGVQLAANERYQVELLGGTLVFHDAKGADVLEARPPLRLDPPEGAVLSLDDKRYRGALEFKNIPGKPDALTVVNDVGLEDYLKGVLPAEMATGWPSEALKAQAVAARTYAVANKGRRADQGFDLLPTVADQVYRGMDAEAADTTQAVEATRGEVMRYQGVPIDALFFSSSGGHTDDAMEVWGMDLPYIKGKPDPDGSPNAHWTLNMPRASVRVALAQLGIDVGNPTGLTITERTAAGRARWMKVTGDKGSAVVDANRFRLAIGLKSTMIDLKSTPDGWVADGSGYGHGLGMSQWGARVRANAGQDHREILGFYYTGITID